METNLKQLIFNDSEVLVYDFLKIKNKYKGHYECPINSKYFKKEGVLYLPDKDNVEIRLHENSNLIYINPIKLSSKSIRMLCDWYDYLYIYTKPMLI